MKMSNCLFILCVFIALSCGSDDDGTVTPTPQDIPIVLTVDFDSLLTLSPFDEASAFVDFGQPSGTPNSTYTTEASLGDAITWSLQTSSANDVILFSGFLFNTPDTILGKYIQITEPMDTANLPAPILKIEVIDADAVDNLEWKYDLLFFAERNGVRTGPYFIDPILRVKSRN